MGTATAYCEVVGIRVVGGEVGGIVSLAIEGEVAGYSGLVTNIGKFDADVGVAELELLFVVSEGLALLARRRANGRCSSA